MLLIARVVVSLIVLGAIAVWWLRSSGKKKAIVAAPAVVGALRASFTQSRSADESEPVVVVAFHRWLFGVHPVAVGVTNRRVLVMKGGGPLQSFAYDDEGEHLPAERKQREKRGFFHWRHSADGYHPIVHQASPFHGEEWHLPVFVQGFQSQKANLREFSRRFYFQWFYD